MGEPQASLKSTVVPLASSTVMVVDDQSTSRAILEQVLRALDERIMVKSFTRPVDAIVWATRQVADLVLADYSMPEMNGIELVRRLRAMPGYESVPILMVTVSHGGTWTRRRTSPPCRPVAMLIYESRAQPACNNSCRPARRVLRSSRLIP